MNEKIALITGGTRGIGLAIAKKFVSKNITVILNYAQNKRAAKRAIKLIKDRKNVKVETYKAFVENEKQVQKMVDYIKKQYGKIDILVNNAGIFTEEYIHKMSAVKWNNTVNINLTGTFHCIKYVSKIMIGQNKGKIINISSQAAERGSIKHCHYSATKGGINSFSISLARELAKYRITVNVVSPGRIVTDIIKENIDKNKKRWLKETPLKRLGKPPEVAEAVYFLASEASDYITGEILHVDGGLTLHK